MRRTYDATGKPHKSGSRVARALVPERHVSRPAVLAPVHPQVDDAERDGRHRGLVVVDELAHGLTRHRDAERATTALEILAADVTHATASAFREVEADRGRR